MGPALSVGLGCVAGLPARPGGVTSGTLATRALQAAEPVEAAVDVARMRATLATLTGKSPLAPALTIPERGSVEGRALTRRFLRESLTAMGYAVEAHGYRQNGENLIARLPASRATAEWILVGAHMDSVRNAGADDNGSGSTAVLEAAAVMQGLADRQVNVMFAWFDEEELGLVGSEAMARDFRKQGLKLTSVHTVDMLGYDADKDRKVEIERPDGGLWDYYQMINKTHALGLPLARTNSGSTDHVAFRDEGFTAVGLCEEWAGGDTTPHYHRKTDAFDTVDVEYLAKGTQLLVAAVADLARKVPAPPATKLIPHDRFPGRDRHFHGDH